MGAARRRGEWKVIAVIIAGVGLPMILAYLLVAADMRSDLSDLKPIRATVDNSTAVIGWPDLQTGSQEAGPNQAIRFEPALWQTNRRVRMLGYMMDGYRPSRDGERVEMFILLPEAGQFLHPAHRIPDQMVEVRLLRATPFTYRRLVWVSGVLERKPGQRDPEQALYAMSDTTIENAADREITRWFRP